MGKKKLAVITLSKAVAQFYVQQFNNLFDSRADVVSYNFEDGSALKIQPADLYVVSTSASKSYQDAQKWIPQGSPFIISNITITKSALNQLLALPRGTKPFLNCDPLNQLKTAVAGERPGKASTAAARSHKENQP